MINANKFLVKRKINARKNYFNITILQKVFDNRYLVVILFLCQSNWEDIKQKGSAVDDKLCAY